MAVFPLTVHLPASGTLPQRDFECFNAIKTLLILWRGVSLVWTAVQLQLVGRGARRREGGSREARLGHGGGARRREGGQGGREAREVGRPGGGRPGWGREVEVLIYNLVQGLLLK